jgi:hypothetical protein
MWMDAMDLILVIYFTLSVLKYGLVYQKAGDHLEWEYEHLVTEAGHKCKRTGFIYDQWRCLWKQ